MKKFGMAYLFQCFRGSLQVGYRDIVSVAKGSLDDIVECASDDASPGSFLIISGASHCANHLTKKIKPKKALTC